VKLTQRQLLLQSNGRRRVDMTHTDTPQDLTDDVLGPATETDQPGLEAVRNAVHNRIWSRLRLLSL